MNERLKKLGEGLKKQIKSEIIRNRGQKYTFQKYFGVRMWKKFLICELFVNKWNTYCGMLYTE
jgi:hypothetical protein